MKKEKKAINPDAKKRSKGKKSLELQKTKNKKSPELRVLILEDNPADAELMEAQLENDGIDFVSQRVDTPSGFLRALKAFKPDFILADYNLPKFDALQALALRKKNAPLTPFIVVTGSISEEIAVKCMKQGADDYLLKDRLARLGEAVRHTRKTRQLQAEKAVVEVSLQAAAERWRTTFDSMNDAVCLLDGQGAVQQCNRAMNRLLELPFNQIIGRDCLDLICGKDKQKSCAFIQMIKTRQRMEEETFWRGHWYQVRVDPVIGPTGKLVGAVHVMTDISARKRIEETLRASSIKLARSQRVGKLGNWEWDVANNRLEWSDEIYRIWEVKKDFPLTSDGIVEMIHPDDREVNRTMVQKFMSDQDEGGYEFRIICPNGTLKHIHQSIEVTRSPSGQAIKMFGIMQDISERKLAEEALRETEKKFRDLAELLPQTVFETDLQGRLTFVNRSAYESFGYDENDFQSGLQIWQMIVPGDRERAIENISRVLHGEVSVGNEYSGKRKDGTVFPILLYSTPIQTAAQPTGIRGILVDISERKRAENSLRMSEERFRKQYDGSPISAFTWQKKGESFVLQGYNASAERITHSKVKEFIGKSANDMYGNRPDIMQAFHQCFEKKSTISLETLSEHFIPNKIVHPTFTFIPPDLIMVHLEDITERKRAEEQIRTSLLEKEVLLKEIHHRVKNNLQIISGLLTLQAAQTDNGELQRMVKDSQSRIWTMALIHQTLYQSGNLAAVDMADYIRNLAGNLLSSHARIAMPPTITFDLLPLRLAIDKAIPLALIINELLTNAMKHAFPDGQPGEICITLQERRGVKFYAQPEECGTDTSRDRLHPHSGTSPVPIEDIEATPKEGTILRIPTHELIVTDNGVGLPDGFDPKNQKSLGLQLVTMLVRQLDGELTIKSNGGAAIHITFDNNEKNKKQS